ncbi:MAG: zf-HC2 domain-containing protein [Acidobacteria bacterium]|nr:zf-HC2 domain-containing protein [Acidobacteriota bacterium]
MTHCTDRLSDYLDGELAADEREAVAAHLTGCAGCAAVLDELRGLRAHAAALPESLPPAADPWPAIAARIASHGESRRAPWRMSFSVPQLAAAAALLLAVGMGAMWMLQPPGAPGTREASRPAAGSSDVVAVSLGDASFDAAIADLEAVLEEGRAHLDPQTVRVLEENLAAIDTAIAEAREALAADPGNLGLTNHLLRTRAMRLGLLRRVVAGAQKEG